MIKNSPSIIAGIYIERDFILAMCAEYREDSLKNLLADFSFPNGYYEIERFEFNSCSQESRKKQSIKLIKKAIEWLCKKNPSFVGVASYGPFVSLDVERRTQNIGYGVLAEDKRSETRRPLSGENLYNIINKHFIAESKNGIPQILIQTDANLSALGEMFLSLKKGKLTEQKNKFVVSLIISDGVGGGTAHHGSPSHRKILDDLWRGELHPEMGHIPTRLHTYDELYCFAGACKFHGVNCMTGVAGIPALRKRWEENKVWSKGYDSDWERAFEELKHQPDHEIWEIEAYYISRLCITVSYMFTPSFIVLDGRMMEATGLIEKVRKWFDYFNKGFGVDGKISNDPYFVYDELSNADRYIRLRSYKEHKSSLIGACYLAAINKQEE